MKRQTNPEETKRAFAFEMWLNAPMPMVTLVKTMDVSRLARLSLKSGVKFNTLMCWCTGLYHMTDGGQDFFASL